MGTKKTTKSKGASFADMAAGYLATLEEEGRSESTVTGYRRELVLAASLLGEETLLDEVTAEEVEAFLGSDAVTKKKDGTEKSKLSIDRSCRVLRQALGWAVEHEILKTAPLPVEKD